MLHILKIDEKWFERICSGQKTNEVRFNDRDYQTGDIIALRPVDSDGNIIIMPGSLPAYEITHVLDSNQFPQGLQPGYCVLSITPKK
jgi:hypothetical protein